MARVHFLEEQIFNFKNPGASSVSALKVESKVGPLILNKILKGPIEEKKDPSVNKMY